MCGDYIHAANDIPLRNRRARGGLRGVIIVNGMNSQSHGAGPEFGLLASHPTDSKAESRLVAYPENLFSVALNQFGNSPLALNRGALPTFTRNSKQERNNETP